MKISEEEIIRLIHKGFDIELISFELDIPIEELRQLKKEMESSQKPKARKYSVQEIIDMKNENAHLKMEKMRENYNRILFAFKEEQAKGQIFIQIRTALMENPEKYHIENPNITIMQVQKLCGGELERAIRVVIKNLIGSKDFERAKELCTSFASKYNGSLSLTNLRKEIRNAEIADIVLKGININGTMEEEKVYLKLIEKGLEIGNVKLEAISLGKSQDGLRNITLADIWPEEIQKVRV